MDTAITTSDGPFEVMLAMKATKEEQLHVAASTEEALAPRPQSIELRALSEALGQPMRCSNELAAAAEIFFCPSRTTNAQQGYFGQFQDAPQHGIHSLVRLAMYRGVEKLLAPGYAVALTGGSSQIPGMSDRLGAELRNLEQKYSDVDDLDMPPHGRVLPVVPEASWAGASLAAALADWDWETPGDSRGGSRLGAHRHTGEHAAEFWSNCC